MNFKFFLSSYNSGSYEGANIDA